MNNGQTPPGTVPEPAAPAATTAPVSEPLSPPLSGRVSGPPVLGLAEAAKACGLSVSTVRRRKRDLISHGATVSETGWQIPVPALVALGMLDRATPPPAADSRDPDTRPDTPGDRAELDRLRELLDQAERRAVQAEQRAAIAEAVAAERDRIIAAKDQTLRMLEAAPVPAAVEPDPVEPKRRRWWHRL